MSRPTRRQFIAASGTAALAATLPLAADAHAAAAASYGGYAMTYFAESNQGLGNSYALHLAVSTDGLQWTPLNHNNPVATPTAGTKGLRDPFILRRQDGTFTVLATDLNGTNWSEPNQYIHAWDSTDLKSFLNYRRIKLHSLTTTHAWATEAFWDAGRGQYAIIYSANDGARDVIMVNYTTDFVTVSAPQTYFDPGFDIIDADVVTGVGGLNYLHYKRGNELYGAKSASLAPGSFDSATYTGPIAHGGTEASVLVKSLTSDTWYLWGDTYTPNGVFHAWQTNDLAGGTWTPVDQRLYTQPLNSKHAGITPLTTAELNALETSTGTSQFAADATFVQEAGLAASTGVSYRSYNYPTRYLRHSDFQLRIDVVSSSSPSVDKQDATFLLTS